MEGSKSINPGIARRGNKIVCSDLATLGLVLGTRGIAGNLNAYGVKKEKGRYVTSISNIKRRIAELEERKARIDNYLLIMKQIIG